MFKIEILEETPNGMKDYVGDFKCCYLASQNGEKSTYIAFTKQDDFKKFKTKKAAENKIEFLKQKQEQNYYLTSFEFVITEVGE